MGSLQDNILVAMSGGVDSSTAALILKQQGYHVKGLIFRMHDEGMTAEDLSNGKLPQNIWHAREAARRMRLEFSIVDVRESFRRDVMNFFIEGCDGMQYPDPCTYCNTCFKLPLLMQEAEKLGCRMIATGHYAIVEYDPSRQRYVVRRSRDLPRDQSHQFFRLSQEQLSRLITPLGTYEKKQTRAIAEEAKLKNALLPQSPEICFIENRNYRAFLDGRISPEALRCAGDPQDLPSFRRTHLRAGNLSFAGIDALPKEGTHLLARIRHPANEAECFVRPLENGSLDIQLEQALSGAAPGQNIVFYEEDIVALGGTILKEDSE